MIIHITPRIYIPAGLTQLYKPSLLEIKCPQLGLELRGVMDVCLRRPLPNKGYSVACRRIDNKAINGLLLEVDVPPQNFTVTTTYLIGAHNKTIEHVVDYRILDTEFDAVTEDALLWHSTPQRIGGHELRWPQRYEHLFPVDFAPRMGYVPDDALGAAKRRPGAFPERIDHLDSDGMIARRHEALDMHTIEERRLQADAPWVGRVPEKASAIKANCVSA